MQLGGLLRRRLHLNWTQLLQPRYGGFALRSFCEQAVAAEDVAAEDDESGVWLFGKRIIDESRPGFTTLWDKIRSERSVAKDATVLKEWKEAGNDLPKELLNDLLLKMSTRTWHSQARKVTLWMDEDGSYELTDEDRMIRMELLCRSNSPEAAEGWFNRLEKKTEAAYLIMLRGFSRKRNVPSTEKMFKELKTSGLMTGPAAYTAMLRMYARIGDAKKAVAIFKEFNESNLGPDADICLALLQHKDLVSNSIAVDEKVGFQLEKLETTPKNRRDLLRVYAAVGNAEGVAMVWEKTLASPPVTVSEYFTAVCAFGDVGNVDKALELGREVEPKLEDVYSIDYTYAMMKVYSLNGEMDKAESLLKMSEGKFKPSFKFCLILIEGYLKLGMQKEAVDSFEKFASRVKPYHHDKELLQCVLRLNKVFEENQDVKSAEKMMAQIPGLKIARVYNSLMKVYISAKTPAYGMRERMVASKVTINKESRALLKELEAIKG